ncbi:MAG: WYL domain-containing protein [Paludibacteraceae bacterium]|nr:WYL domain-containing protein [Paludibacteraceae bacterium]
MAKQSSAQLFRSYVWLVDTIYSAGHITRAEINRKWAQNYSLNSLHESAIPERTFHNWIWAIQDLFQINIECSRKLGGAYYIEDAEDLERGGVRQWLINTFAVNNLINESHHLKRQILFEKIPSGQRFLTPIIEAMRDKMQLKMTYHGYHKNHSSTFMVKPYCVKVYRQRWYMLAQSEKPDMIVYALDRIENLETTDIPYKMPVDFNPEEYFYSIVGVSDAHKKPKFVTIRVNSWQANYFRSLPLHHSQEETKCTDEYSIFKYYLVPNYEFKQELRSHGSAVQVLEPQKLVDEMKMESEKLMELYDNII